MLMEDSEVCEDEGVLYLAGFELASWDLASSADGTNHVVSHLIAGTDLPAQIHVGWS
jgi:hypothetical protein